MPSFGGATFPAPPGGGGGGGAAALGDLGSGAFFAGDAFGDGAFAFAGFAAAGAVAAGSSTGASPRFLLRLHDPGRGRLCGNQQLIWGVPTKLQNSLSRSHRSRFG